MTSVGAPHAMMLGLLLATAAVAAAAGVDGPRPVAVDTGSSDWNMGYGHTEAEAGISWYTHMWQMFPSGVPANWGIGMPGTWLHGTGISFKDACACNPSGWPNSPAVAPHDQANHCCDKPTEMCSFLYETIEGGPQDDERWRTGANVGCFSYTAGAGLFNYGDNSPSNQHPCDEIAFASLSNQMLLQPNGASFAKDGMLGVGYVRTPLGKTSPSDARNFWTLVFDTETFSGPLGYYLPEFFAGRDKSAAPGGEYPDPSWWTKSSTLKDMGSPGVTMNNDQIAMEWNHGITYQQNSSEGKLFIKLPNISFPFSEGGELILAMGNQVHTDTGVSVPLEAALQAGKLDVSTIMANAKPANCIKEEQNATFALSTSANPDPSRAEESKITIGRYATNIENGTCVWKLTGQGEYLEFPRYFDGKLQPVDANEVEASVPELVAQQFPLDKTILTRTFDALTGKAALKCYSEPGAADPALYCQQSKVNGYWLGWRWYKFVEQPALQRAKLSETEKAFLQRRVETLHGMVGRVSRWLKPGQVPPGSELAHVDPAALVTPPKGLERGYVPIVMWEGGTRPEACVDVTN